MPREIGDCIDILNFMDKTEKIFVDGIESISMVDGTFRLEMFVFKNGEARSGQSAPQHAVNCELITTAAGLGRMQNVINQIISDLQAKADRAATAQTGNTGLSDNFKM